jgi:hypothetical protein
MEMDRLAIISSVFTFITVIVAIGCFTGIVTSWLSRRGKTSLPSRELLERLDEISSRLATLDGSIDTMAVEVERISEAQRFTARVLAERVAVPAALPDKPRPTGTSTPH